MEYPQGKKEHVKCYEKGTGKVLRKYREGKGHSDWEKRNASWKINGAQR